MSDTTQPGYFRLGSVVLQIPPVDISTNKIINDDQVATLRTSTPMFVKSGQARWDVTIHWKSVRSRAADGTIDYTQWQDLRRVIATFRASPFVEVENDFLRQHFVNIHQGYKQQRMAFALKQIRIDTDPNTTNVIDVTLTMSLFNYAPFSLDFSYAGGDGSSVDAIDSPDYNFYIDHWITQNMDSRPRSKHEPDIQKWEHQEDGTLTFKWRRYIFIPFTNSVPPQSQNKASIGYNPVVPPPTTTNGVRSPKLSNEIQKILNDAAAKYGLDPAIITAQCLAESGGNPDAGRGRTDKGGLGLMQLVASTAKVLGVSDVFDPVQNANGACRYLKERLDKFGNYPHALAAYNVGDAYVYAYRDGKSFKKGNINPLKVKTADGIPPAGIPNLNENAGAYVRRILANAKKLGLTTPILVKGTNSAPVTPTSFTPTDVPDKDLLDKVNDAVTKVPPGEWRLDHYTGEGVFFYEEEEIFLANTDSEFDGDFNMFPNQLSVVMINNLPLIPLAGMQYPTYQHVGPTDTIISISMNSVGDESDVLNEPAHEGVQAITAMSSTLEDQFHNLRTTVRAVSAVHRMQAVFIENQILNMLGIRGTMLRGINTETVPDSTGLVQVSVMGSQYENIFEERRPFRVNGISNAYKPAIQNILKSGELNKTTPEEQHALAVVKEFSDAWQKHDETYLAREIFRIVSDKIDFLGATRTPATDIWAPERDLLLQALELRGNPTASSITGSTGLGSGLQLSGLSLAPLQSDIYPGLQKRRLVLFGSTVQMSYADYFIFSRLPLVLNQSTIDTLRTKIEAKFATQKSDILESMYQTLFDFELQTNPLFNRQLVALTNSPKFRQAFTSAVTVDGPAVQAGNENHFCYGDLGLTNYDQNPGDYFIDHNAILRDGVVGRLQDIIKPATDAANTVNAVTSTAAGSSLAAAGQTGFVFSGDKSQQLPGDSKALSRMINVPAYSLNTAFPTFKLMLIEEDNTGPFFAFDNFYSYASVMDIEVIKYADKPDAARIQITNLSHILNHRLYDDTAAGKLEASDDKFNIAPNGSLAIGGPGIDQSEATQGGSSNNAGIIASKTASGQLYQKKNMAEGRGETNTKVPLKYFALQTGSKIQVRMGYSNNPDNLFPVFTGQVTDIEGDDILTLTCQSFQLELMNVPGTMVTKDGGFGFNAALGSGEAMGGFSLSNSGDTGSVIKKMLTCEGARHFGHWQIGGVVDPLLKGFTWTELGGKALSNFSNPTINKIGALLQTGYDRSAENILINSSINFDSTKPADNPANAGRRQFDENTSWLQSYLRIGTAAYSVPKQSELSVWDIIKDVSRRYPHYNLLVKDYGFPYGADATLVYAHPLDWYYSRPKLYGDAEKEKANNGTQNQLFQDWWNHTGKAKWDEIFNHAYDSLSIAGVGIRQALGGAQQGLTNLAGSGPEGFVMSIQQAHGILTGTTETVPATDALNKFFNALQEIQNVFTKVALAGNLTQGFYSNLDQNFQSLLREWESYLVQSDPAANSSRLRPVRKYHLIDVNHIVHNGLSVDDDIYNAVKIMDEAPLKFNQNIPGNHLRILNATALINNPGVNATSKEMKRVYAQSFLREEVGKMYRGDLIIRGVAEIEPMDIILMQDPSTGMVGPIEVDTVIHSFNMENGYITIIKPRLHVIANESVSMNINRALGFAWANAYAELHNLAYNFLPGGKDSTVAGTGLGIAGGAFIGVAIGAAIVWAPPIGITVALLSLVAGYGIITWTNAQQDQNFFKLQPLSRFGRPWIGGLQGFAISDFAYSVLKGLEHFDAEEISPTIESWNELLHYQVDYLQEN